MAEALKLGCGVLEIATAADFECCDVILRRALEVAKRVLALVRLEYTASFRRCDISRPR